MKHFFSFFRSVKARSFDRAFLIASLDHQLRTARAIRSLRDCDRILFDPRFVTATTACVGPYRVSVNESGQEAVLLKAAQDTLSAEYYFRFFSDQPDVIFRSQQVLLLASGLPSDTSTQPLINLP